MKKSVILGVVILVIGVGFWLRTQPPKSVPAPPTLPAKNIAVPATLKVEQPAVTPVEKQQGVAVLRTATSKVMANSSAGLTSVPASRHVNADGLLLAEDLMAADGTVRMKKRYNYNADKILTQELEIRVSDGAITRVDYIADPAGKMQIRVTDEKGNVTVE